MKFEESSLEADENTILLEDEMRTDESSEIFYSSSPSFFMLYADISATAKMQLLVGFLFSAGSGVIFTETFYLIGNFYDDIFKYDKDEAYDETCRYVRIMVCLGIVLLCFGVIASYCFCRVSQEIGKIYRSHYFHSIMNKDISRTFKATESSTEMSSDCELIEKGTGDRVMVLVEAGTFCLTGLYLAFRRSPQLATVGIGFLFFSLLGHALFIVTTLKSAQMMATKYGKAANIAEESLLEVKTISAFNAQTYVSKKYNAELEGPATLASRLAALGGSGKGLMWLSWTAATSAIFWCAAEWIHNGSENWVWGDKICGGDSIVVVFVVVCHMTTIGTIAPCIAASAEARLAAARAQNFFNEPTKFTNGTKQVALKGRIEFRDVHFTYPEQSGSPVLKGLSFVCEPGQKTAIVGESGAGKSTIFQLLERFYEASEGQVLYDGVPVAEFDIDDLRRQVGYVSQEPVLFNLTVRENIVISCPTASEEQISAAIEHANMSEFLASLEHGIDTVVKGTRLSGGQKQRVAIARALVRDPKILLLDEATSALDSESEYAILRALDAIHAERKLTIVSVAQKLGTIMNSEKIVVLREGQNEEEGTHETLLARGGLYWSMCTSQGMSTEVFAETVEVREQVTTTHSSAEEPTPDLMAKSWFSKFPLLRLSAITLKSWPLLIVAIGSASACGASLPAFGYYIAKEISYILKRPPAFEEEDVAKESKRLLFLAAFGMIAFTVMHWTFGWISARVTLFLRERVFFKMLCLDAAYFDKRKKAALLVSLDSDAFKASDIGGALLSFISVFVAAFVASILIALLRTWKLGLVAAVALPFECFGCFRGFLVRARGMAPLDHQQASALVLDSALNIKIVKAFQMQGELGKLYEKLLQNGFEESRTESIFRGAFFGLYFASILWMFSLNFWYGALLVKNEEINYGDVTTTTYSALMAVLGVAMSAACTADLEQGSRAASQILGLIDYVPLIDSVSASGVAPKVEGSILFANVSFKYPRSDDFVLKHVSFSVARGQHFGITGVSGSGKSTLTQLLLRFYDSQEGHILIDNLDITKYNVRHLRAHIAVVGQEPVLFSGSIRDNVDFGLGKSDEEVQRALAAVQVTDFMDKLDDPVDFRGTNMSGGQRQRFAIARAILRDPKILILDEATSVLDSNTEQQIFLALGAADKGRTVVSIAHRLSTIEKCDQILVLDGGEIKEQGTHESLSAREDGVYRKLLAASGE